MEEIERKFVVQSELEGYHKCISIYQAYINLTKDYEERVRKIIDESGISYLYTKKITTDNPMIRKEEEFEITEERFNRYLLQAEKVIYKKRYYFFTECVKEFTIDDFGNGLLLCEIELNSTNELFVFPKNIEVLKEVTDDCNYKNQNLAKEVDSFSPIDFNLLSPNKKHNVYSLYSDLIKNRCLFCTHNGDYHRHETGECNKCYEVSLTRFNHEVIQECWSYLNDNKGVIY